LIREDVPDTLAIALLKQCNKAVSGSVFQSDAPVRGAREEEVRALAADQLPRPYSLARRLVGDEAEDAVQDCLLKAFRALDRLENMVAGPAWLTSILVNTCRDRLRARVRRPQEVSFDEAEDFSLYRQIADEDPFPYSDSLHLDFLGRFGPEDVRAVLASL